MLHASRMWLIREGGFYWLVVTLLVVLYGLELREIHDSASGPRIFRDTKFYSVPESVSWFGPEIWKGFRSPLAMLIFKRCAGEWQRVVDVFYLFSFVSWTALALSVAYAVRPSFLRPIAAAAVLALALSRVVLEWNHVMLGEASAISAVALCAASGVLFTTKPNWLTLALLTLGAALCALARDSAAYTLLAIAALVLLIAGVRRLQRRRLNVWVHAAAGALIVGALAGYASAESSGRWQYPLLNVIADRVIRDEEATAFFVQRGMPTHDRALVPGRNRRAYANDERLAPFREWVYEHGKSVYVAYLLTHPKKTLLEAVENYPAVLAGSLRAYGVKRIDTHPALDELWDRSHLELFLLLIGVSVLLATLLPRVFSNPAIVVGALAGLGTVPHAFVVYHGDAMEVARHGVTATAELRLSVVLLVTGLLAAKLSVVTQLYKRRWRHV